jgi:hypothetical protein
MSVAVAVAVEELWKICDRFSGSPAAMSDFVRKVD